MGGGGGGKEAERDSRWVGDHRWVSREAGESVGTSRRR